MPGKYFPLKPLFIVYRGADLRVLHALADYLSKNVPTMEDYLMDRVNKWEGFFMWYGIWN